MRSSRSGDQQEQREGQEQRAAVHSARAGAASGRVIQKRQRRSGVTCMLISRAIDLVKAKAVS